LSQKGELIVQVTGMGAGRGDIRYGLYNSPKDFPTREGRMAKGGVPVMLPQSTIVIKNLTPGFYALAIFQDENRNRKFDQGFFGIPLELYAFSNNVRGFFSAPDFKDAKFRVSGPKTEISIELSE
jgi:uncharacterized protein (DUF2141 family)